MKSLYIIYSILLFSNCSFSQDYNVEEVSCKNNELKLYADIFIPKNSKEIKTGIVLIQGSGNSDRSNAWSRAYAEFLVDAGYYVLLPDKRGCGKSEGDWKKASFIELAQDAMASFSFFKETYQLEKAGMMGLSQGGFIVPIVASQHQEIDFVIDIVGTTVTIEEQLIHEVANSAIKKGLSPNEVKEVLELHVLFKKYAFDRDWKPLQSKFEELKESSWAAYANTFPDNPDLWVWDYLKMNINFNPMDYWIQVTQPVFVAYGIKDQNDNIPVYESVYRMTKGFSEIDKTNYEIQLYDTGHAMYEDDRAALRQEFIDDLIMWLNKNI
tara:strand:- start:920 stop:1894 length:975 start_codon:yes stop_codon:yes gene_type:complete